MLAKLNSKLFVYRNLLFAVIVLPLLLSACASLPGPLPVQDVVPCVAGDCLALQPGTVQWIFNTAFRSPADFVVALRGTTNPQYLVVVSRIANGFGVAGADLSQAVVKDGPQVVCGTWMNCKDFTSLMSTALKSGHWEVLQRDQVKVLIGETASKAGPAVALARWIIVATASSADIAAGALAFDAETLDDILRGVLEDAGLPYSVQVDG